MIRTANDTYATALDHWLASGAADLEDRAPGTLAELGLAVGTDALMTSLSGGQAARVALAALAAEPLRHRAARRADQRPRPRRPRAARVVRPRPAGGRRARLPRPRVPGPLRHAHRRARPGPAAGERLRRRLRRLPRGAGRRAAARAGGVRRVRREEGRPAVTGAHPARVELAGRAQRDQEVTRQRQDPPQGADGVVGEAGPEGAPDGVADRATRRGRGTAQGVGAAVRHRVRAAVIECRGDARRGRRATRRLRARPGVGAGLGRRPHRHHRSQRLGQDHAAQAAARARTAGRGTGLPRRQRRHRRDRPGPYVVGRAPAPGGCLRARRTGHDRRRGPHPAREVRSPGRPGGQPASSGCRPASAPARRWRSSRHAG